jgi:O-antigen/teichoic acid export membrane protein
MPTAFIRNTFFGFLSGGAIAVAGLIGSVVVARLLGPEGAGAIAYAAWCVLVATTLADAGIAMVLQRYVPNLRAEGKDDEADGVIGACARVALVIVVGGAVLLFGWLHWLGNGAIETSSGSPDRVLVVLSLAVLAKGMGELYMAYLRGQQRFQALARLTVLTSLIQLLVTVVGAWLFGVIGALTAYVAGFLIPALQSSRLLRNKPVLGRELRRRVVRFALTSWSAGLIGALVWNRTEIVFLQHYVGIREVGFFAAASALTFVGTVLPPLFTSALLPYFSEQHGLNAREQMHRLYKTMTGVVALASMPACVGMAAIAPVLVPVLFGAEFADAVPAAMVLMIPAAVGAVAASTTNLVYSTGKSAIMLASNTIGLTGAILLGLLVIPHFGLMGAAWSRTAVHVLVVAIETWYVSRRLGFTPPYRALGAITLAALAQGLVAYGVIWGVGGVSSLVLAIPAGVVVYLLALRVLAVLPMVGPALVETAVEHAPRQVRSVASRVLRMLVPGPDGRVAPD